MMKIGQARTFTRQCSHILSWTVFLFVAFILQGCASKPLQPPPADYASKAIRLHFDSSYSLNLYDGQAHALVMCVYQLTDPEVFEDKLQEPMGPNRLLACDQFDPSVTARKRVIVQPGTKTSVVLNRSQGTRYLGLIAGYYQRQGNDFYMVTPIPVVIKRVGLFKKKAFLGILEMDIQLGPSGIGKTDVIEEK